MFKNKKKLVKQYSVYDVRKMEEWYVYECL